MAARHPASPAGKTLLGNVSAAAWDVSAAGSREGFVRGMSAVAQNAKRARALLQDFVALQHTTIDETRELILEARGLEAIFRASLNTARRRAAAARRGRVAPKTLRSGPSSVRGKSVDEAAESG